MMPYSVRKEDLAAASSFSQPGREMGEAAGLSPDDS